MSERTRFWTDFVAAICPDCGYNERAQSPTPDEQKALIRRARAHARKTGHGVSLERGQLTRVEA